MPPAAQLGGALGWDSLAAASAEMATTLAEAGKKAHGADWCLATAEYPPFVPRVPPYRLHMAIASRGPTTEVGVPYLGHLAILKPRGAKQALNFLRLTLLHEGSAAADA